MFDLPYALQQNAGLNESFVNREEAVTVGGKVNVNLKFSDDIDGLTDVESECELTNLIK